MTQTTETPDASENTPVASVPSVTSTWKTRTADWLEQVGKRAGLPSLVVALVALAVSITGLSYIKANYNLSVAANRPNLVSYGLVVNADPRSPNAQLGFNNVGKVTGRRGTVTLFSLPSTDAPVEKKLITAPIVGAGTNIFPGGGTNTVFDGHLMDGVRFVLVCATYFVDSGETFEQAFLFERDQPNKAEPTITRYSEVAQPDLSRCPH